MDEDHFEDPILELERRVEALSGIGDDVANRRKRDQLEIELQSLRGRIFAGLSPWQKTLVARHAKRPYTLDYVRHLVEGFVEIHGDRRYSDDAAIVTGFGTFGGRPVLVVGHQKGRDTKEKIFRNFGMPRPEGYRKALRAMELAEKFRRPILCFIDTPGAYPGIGAEERGQAEAIAKNLLVMARLTVPILVTVAGEGGSGGALAIGVGDRVNMLEFAVYSVISPEGCAAILWRDATKSRDAARAMKMTAPDLLALDIIDEIVPEVVGGAHVDPARQAAILGDVLERQLLDLERQAPDALIAARYDRFRRMGRAVIPDGVPSIPPTIGP
ncbi:MAG TPA: acetyl-CoA carboxylase carboxyltransferase subunit alpha [Candidatus Polarisedimenticolaceae bacterium]|nr:acetyl-CoA carboxylase carboxyltransferase subunit alpha [Candidatus Polarisedimenticolaceae bacterium]